MFREEAQLAAYLRHALGGGWKPRATNNEENPEYIVKPETLHKNIGTHKLRESNDVSKSTYAKSPGLVV